MALDAFVNDGWSPPAMPQWMASQPLFALQRPPTAAPTQRRETNWHQHPQGQILYVERGVAQVLIDGGTWLLPPHRAAWIPPGVMHASSVSGERPLTWSLFLSPTLSRHMAPQPCAVSVEPLTRMLLQQAVGWTPHEQRQASQRRLMMVLLDRLRNASKDAFHLPMPTDRRLLRIARAILAQPGQARTLDEWSDWAGVSARTVNRLFKVQVGMSFMAWRQEAMLMHARSSLSRGESVSNVADALGYSSPSNFIAMFRRSHGESPTRYLTRSGEMA
ncbi:helix-turn-helix domain-containing protein [Variovorax sp. OV329]|uniref:AraC family transcriptional regulator n=1 Tax=Variovorax sp. OV329 TaxID=1882825 RepID=UPI0008F2542C|nr:helix-turn-helix transcriptional regulator [Variovorax sp. OV329]SFM92507.1 transcriptional regulator, AraC family [Variovorax sp. OV329]